MARTLRARGGKYTPVTSRVHGEQFAFTSSASRAVTAPATTMAAVTTNNPNLAPRYFWIAGGAQAGLFGINADGTNFRFLAASTVGVKTVIVGATEAGFGEIFQTITVTVS